jgi:hypothetical protein
MKPNWPFLFVIAVICGFVVWTPQVVSLGRMGMQYRLR